MSDVPALAALRPKPAMRMWRRYLADREPLTGAAAEAGDHVRLAILEFDLNFGKLAEEKSRANLAAKLAAFEARCTVAAELREP